MSTMEHTHDWVLFPRDLQHLNKKAKYTLLGFLLLDAYPDGLIFWMGTDSGNVNNPADVLFARKLISRKKREKTMYIQRFYSAGMMNMCLLAICSAGRPLRVHCDELARLGFFKWRRLENHPLFDPNLMNLVADFICAPKPPLT